MINICFIVICCIGFMVSIGWALGTIEGICITICIGFSVDFVVHVAIAYVEADILLNRYEKQNQLTSEMWKLCLKTDGIEPFIDWIDKDNQLIYKFGISVSSDSDIIYSYFRKYLCLVEFL